MADQPEPVKRLRSTPISVGTILISVNQVRVVALTALKIESSLRNIAAIIQINVVQVEQEVVLVI